MFDDSQRAGGNIPSITIACLLSQAADYTSVQPIPREGIRRHTKALYFDAHEGGFNVYGM